MKKLNLALLFGVSAMILSACTATVTEKYTTESVEMGDNTSGQIGETVKIAPESLELSVDHAAVYIGESFTTLKTRVLPVQASDSQILYSSKDESIATVDSNGVILGKKAGVTTITATVKDTDISQEVEVLVTSKVTSNVPTALESARADMQAKQEARFPDGKPQASEVRRETHRMKTRYNSRKEWQDGKVPGTVIWDYEGEEIYRLNREAGYFSVGGYDITASVEGGTKVTENSEWVFRTNDSFMTYIYHTAGNSKTYLQVNTSSFLGQSKFNAVGAILDAVFNSGKALADNPDEWSLCADDLVNDFKNYAGSQNISFPSGGSYTQGDDSYFKFVLEQNNYVFSIESVEESDYEIPAGTSVTMDYHAEYTWKNGAMYSYEVAMQERYEMNNLITGVKEFIVYDIIISYNVKVDDEVVITLPVTKEYTEVADIFDL